MRTIGVVAFITIYDCIQSANNGGSATEPTTWNEEEFLYLPFNAILIALSLWAVIWGIVRYRKGLDVFGMEPTRSNTLRDELRRHRRFDRDR